MIVSKLFDDCQQAFRRLSTGFFTIVGKLVDNCRQAVIPLSVLPFTPLRICLHADVLVGDYGIIDCCCLRRAPP